MGTMRMSFQCNLALRTYPVFLGLACLGPTPAFGQQPVRDSFAVVNRRTLAVDTIECERIAVGKPDDYKPCIASLPSGELLLTAFHQYKKENGKVLEQNLLFRS